MRADAFHVGDVFADKFEIRELIGRGGMGVVYRAWHRYLDKDVALKLVPLVARNASVDMKERFRKETAAMGKLKHPNIVEVFDGGVLDDTAYIAMELMTGWNLRQLLLKGRLRHLQICLFLAQVSDALFCLHQNKILHRDIKPENLFVTMDLRVKIIDFGLARVRVASKYATKNPIPAGTPQYMAPEQMLNAPMDESVDVYALGMVAWEATTGKHPIAAATGMVADRDEWIHRMMSGVPLPDLSEQNCGAPPALVSLVMRCLSFDAAQRPTAADISTALRRLARELSEQPPSREANEPLSIEERLVMLPPSTAKLDAPTIVDALDSETVTLERPLPWGGNVDAPTERGGHSETLALSGSLRDLHLEVVPSEGAPATGLPATPIMQRDPAPTAPAPTPLIAPATTVPKTPLMAEAPRVHLPAPQVAIREATPPKPMPSTLQSGASFDDLAAQQAEGRARRHPITVASPRTPQLGTPLPRNTEVMAPQGAPPNDEAAPPRRTVPMASATPSIDALLAADRATQRDGTPAVRGPAVADARRWSSRDEPAFTPGPVASPATPPAYAPQRTRGASFLAGFVVVGCVAAALFVARLHAMPSTPCARGVGSMAASFASDARAGGARSVEERASPFADEAPSRPSIAADASASTRPATPATPVTPAATGRTTDPKASARPTPLAAPSGARTSDVFDTWN